MPFQKGHKLSTGRPKGSKDIKTAQWENIGNYLVEEGSAKYLEHLKKLAASDPEKYTDAYLKILEYFKPKRAREDGKGNADIGTNINITSLSDDELRKLAGESD